MADHGLTGTHHIDGSQCTMTDDCPWSAEEYMARVNKRLASPLPPDESLSRFAGMNPKPRPSHTIITPNRFVTERVLVALLNSQEVFTVEPSQTHPGIVWHLGVFDSALEHIAQVVDVANHEHEGEPVDGKRP